MQKGKKLKHGDCIGIVAPSSPIDKGRVKKAKKAIEAMGFEVVVGQSCYESYGYLAGEDRLRADDINRMFEDRKIDGIIALRGGYGASRILDLIDYDLVAKNPKVFVGYSDITALHTAFRQLGKLVTYHGPMAASDFATGVSDFTRNSFLNMLVDENPSMILENPKKEELTVIREGRARGVLVGGNLALIVNTIGTDYEIDTEDKILLIEEVGEDPYAVDRMLTQLALAGKFKDLRGLVFGDFNNCVASKSEYEKQLPLLEVLKDRTKDLDIPIVYNFQIGHCEPVLTVPLGIEYELNTVEKTLKMLENPNK